MNIYIGVAWHNYEAHIRNAKMPEGILMSVRQVGLHKFIVDA